ncbi:methylmalonyl-CoA/ethylmalonyl-CoA epimerase [Propionibacterium cyclohexanicum]|uniref:Methylmalonyl-CoA/ethylmalonyl-CoA epimerase n=1 Tax=Propionibacterium cyclohexanicum TaxID=64702 RepID=A0A1H9T2M6_9ACTN|nr:VOC family protein [Propionibacterium cyclohexanicum]SER91398.1 methylmalonyl-CoA/ethylmalonyl-CoA epimerase [Propionibacterium cyclohexanicum]
MSAERPGGEAGVPRELRLDHVGVRVRDLEQAASAFERLLGYRRATEPVVNSRQGIRGLFLTKPGCLPIKLVTPLDPGSGGHFGLHHLAFITSDVEASLQELSVAGARVLAAPAPGEMFDDELIAFVYAAGINVELVTTDEWRARLPGDPRAAARPEEP